ncbi:MAG: tRNA (adenosine(37)-N6)-threonylcarbamoyltransferase complex transferase subunit TsaD [Flavobacteriales bacterium]|nr:tRNA (adenosine(37)-N6)-threonylcarbamoyltransferase complex transferase subunit TsaD [Flavobacteriales bacterium]MDG1767216.1 tRNA (adenosine(37)-N6)-threonylcarbamoyltransferase complex transferase subunit TsaD [Flavobacteriales bacterium]
MSLKYPEKILLAIESSCDDTSAAILKGNKILSNFIANQAIHEEYGGVVPELASREHQKNIVPVVAQALKMANLEKGDLDAIAFTQGPGLMGSLMVGGSFAKSLALGLNLPLYAVHHMHAHILAHFIDDAGEKQPEFPFMCLTVSGGHTQIVLVKSAVDMQIVGQTIDDAAGEAFDKTAKIMGLPYPGGPLIDRYSKEGDPQAFAFSKARLEGFDFSFSGFKTSVLRVLEKEMKVNPQFIEENKYDLCASIQWTIVSTLLDTLERAAKEHGIQQIAIAGGVSANSALREGLETLAQKHGWTAFIPKFEYCTDNAAMIAMAGMFQLMHGREVALDTPNKARLAF